MWRYELTDGTTGTVEITDQEAARHAVSEIARGREIALIERVPPLTPSIVRLQSPDDTWWEQRVNNQGHSTWVPIEGPGGAPVTPPVAKGGKSEAVE